jgi:two-component sensor histidine kinase
MGRAAGGVGQHRGLLGGTDLGGARRPGRSPPLWPLLRLEVPVWAYWLAATIPIVMLSRRRPLDQTRPWSSIGLHLASATVFATGFVGFRLLWYQAFNPYPFLDPMVSRWFWRMFRESFVDGFVLYWAVVGVYHAFANWSRLRQRELEASAIRGRLAEATLEMLRMQLRPHFLFNALNTVSAVLETDPRRARRVLGRLGELLRASLRTDGRQEVSLNQEMDLVRAYLEVEQVRFGDRLGVEITIAPDVRWAAVPNLLLQPLVENAVRHGIAPRQGPGRVAIQAEQRNGDIVLQIEDDGLGLPARPLREGVGLGNTRRRLTEMHGGHDRLTLIERPAGGVRVSICIPFRLLSQGMETEVA